MLLKIRRLIGRSIRVPKAGLVQMLSARSRNESATSGGLERGLEQEEVGKRVGVSPAALSRIERGSQLPWPSLRARLARFYDLSETELFADIDAAQAFLRQTAGEKATP